MNAFERYLAQEIPAINTFLEEATSSLNPLVQPVVRHMLEAGGKRLRPLLTILTARAFGHHQETIYPLACSLELLHSATLLHDDIVDGSSLRRGRETAHLRFGATHAILAGDALLALANRIVADYDMPELNRILSEGLLRTATGEILELAHLRDTELALPAYLTIITDKTAYLIQAACLCGAVVAGADAKMRQAAMDLGLNCGIAFQLVDDALDYTSATQVSGKPASGDLKEGKVTLPLILYLAGLPDDVRRRLGEKYQQNRLAADDIEQLRDAIIAGGHAEKTRELAASYLQSAQTALAVFPPSPETELIRQILAPMINREK